MVDPPTSGVIEKIIGAIEGTGVGFLVQKPKSIKEFLIRGAASFIAGVTLADSVSNYWGFDSWIAAAFVTSLVFWPVIGLVYNPQTILEIIRLVMRK